MAKPTSFTMFAYGTNISQGEMKSHSEDVVFIGYGTLENFQLKFRGFANHGVATLEKKKGASVPIAVYDISQKARLTLDNFETFPYAYKRLKVKATFNGKPIKGFVYVLKLKLPPQMPNNEYIKALRLGYFVANFDDAPINEAIVECGGTLSEGEIL